MKNFKLYTRQSRTSVSVSINYTIFSPVIYVNNKRVYVFYMSEIVIRFKVFFSRLTMLYPSRIICHCNRSGFRFSFASGLLSSTVVVRHRIISISNIKHTYYNKRFVSFLIIIIIFFSVASHDCRSAYRFMAFFPPPHWKRSTDIREERFRFASVQRPNLTLPNKIIPRIFRHSSCGGFGM